MSESFSIHCNGTKMALKLLIKFRVKPVLTEADDKIPSTAVRTMLVVLDKIY